MDPDEQSRPKLARGVRLRVDTKTGEPMLLFPEGVLFLSATANDILSRCSGKETVSDILVSLGKEYDADRETLRQDVLDCLGDLYQRKLVVF
jgi:coenzyme PQQ biosynthesis protein PqqD